MSTFTKFRIGVLATLGAAFFVGSIGAKAASEGFPSKPIRMVVPAPPGGGTDGMARLVGNALAQSAGWTFIPENRPGAGGNIGFDIAFKSAPDGHTLAMGESSNMIVNQFLYSNIPFDIEKDMQPVVLVARVPMVLAVSASGKNPDMASLIAAGKSGSLSYASSGNGTLAHLLGELWKDRAQINMVHIPYRGAAPAMTDLVGGQVDVLFTSLTVALPMIQAGKIRALAVASPDRVAAIKDVPTMAEAGYKDIEASVVFGIVGPSGMPPSVLEQINGKVNEALVRPEIEKQLASMGVERAPGTFGGDSASFEKLLRAERAKWAPVIKSAGIKID